MRLALSETLERALTDVQAQRPMMLKPLLKMRPFPIKVPRALPSWGREGPCHYRCPHATKTTRTNGSVRLVAIYEARTACEDSQQSRVLPRTCRGQVLNSRASISRCVCGAEVVGANACPKKDTKRAGLSPPNIWFAAAKQRLSFQPNEDFLLREWPSGLEAENLRRSISYLRSA